MPYIETKNSTVGIRGLMEFKSSTGIPLAQLAQSLLAGPSPLSRFERELIGSYVCAKNKCEFCSNSHFAIAEALSSPEERQALQAVKNGDILNSSLSKKMQVLLKIAGLVQESGRLMNSRLAQEARDQGASDEEIHDAVLIAAAFAMYNRYVDGLGALLPENPNLYHEVGQVIAEQGYLR